MKRSLDELLAKGKKGLKFGKSLPIYLTLGLAAAFIPINAQRINEQEQVDKSYGLGDVNQVGVLSDTTAPEIDVYNITNPIFSPNGDGVKDSVTIDLEFFEKVAYDIEIIDSSRTIIPKSWSGTAINPKPKSWDGTCSICRRVMPEGIYNIKVSLKDSVGNTFVDSSKTITLDTTTDLNIAEESAVPSEYSLSQNYPNPFNPLTTISYTIPKREHVELNVYNLRGRKLETLVNEEQSPGSYQVPFNASKYPSGIYFYQLRAGDYTKTEKMAVMK